MGFTNKFAESFARSKTMTGPERKANEIMGKLLLKKAIVPNILMFIVLLGLTYLIDKQMNKDMSLGFSIGILWMTVIRIITETFVQ